MSCLINPRKKENRISLLLFSLILIKHPNKKKLSHLKTTRRNVIWPAHHWTSSKVYSMILLRISNGIFILFLAPFFHCFCFLIMRGSSSYHEEILISCLLIISSLLLLLLCFSASFPLNHLVLAIYKRYAVQKIQYNNDIWAHYRHSLGVYLYFIALDYTAVDCWLEIE